MYYDVEQIFGGMKFKVPYVFKPESLERTVFRQDYNVFGVASDTWKVFYFFRYRASYPIKLYSSYGRTEGEARLALIRAVRNNRKIKLKKKHLDMYKCVSIDTFIAKCRKMGKRELLRETLEEKRKHHDK